MTKSRVEWACWLAEKGIHIFEVESLSKRPKGGHSWMSRCTIDPEQIKKWDAQSDNPNWGAWLGDNYAVIDLDVKPNINGVAIFEELCVENGMDTWDYGADTFTVKTPSGGYHLYFKVDTPIANANKFPKGIDVRAAVGFVVIPGCEIIKEDFSEGTYEVVNPDVDIAACPEWIMSKYLRDKNVKDPNRHVPLCEPDLPENIEQALEWLRHAEVATEGAEGDQRTYDVCCQMRDFGLSEEQTLITLNTDPQGPSWNQRCDPSWDDGELSIKARNAETYAGSRPGCEATSYRTDMFKQARPEGGFGLTAEKVHEMVNTKSRIDQIVDNSLADRRERKKQEEGAGGDEIPEDVADDNDDGPDAQDNVVQFWWGVRDFSERRDIREYVIKDWLIAHGVTALLAKRGTGKSTVALDLAMHLAHDMDWWDTPTMKGWKVIYICGEDDEGMILNVRAWAKYNNRGLPPNDRFKISGGIIKMTSRTELEFRMEEMVAWADGARCVIILDTWARATSGFSANTQEEMDSAYENAEKMAAALQGPMIACFHPPKEGKLTIRGSAVQEDASSGIWTLTDEGTSRRLRITRAKGKGHGRYRDFKFKQVDLEGKDFYDDDLQGIVAIKDGGTEDEGSKTSEQKLNAARKAWALMVVGCEEFPMMSNYDEPKNLRAENVGKFICKVWRDAERGVVEAETFKTKYLQRGIDLGYASFFDTEKSVQTQLRNYFFSDGSVNKIEFEGQWTVEVLGKEFVVTRAPEIVI